MSELPVPAVPRPAPAVAQPATPPDDLGDIAHLFRFMRDAERRFETLRMTLVDRRAGARTDTVTRATLWLRHPGRSKLVAGDPEGRTRGGYQVWIGDGETVTHYDADANVVRSRPRLAAPVGAHSDEALPPSSRVYRPLTPLPSGTVADTFVHPYGLCRNVLSTGRLGTAGVDTIAGREAVLIRCDHPRTAKVLADRPDHRIVVGVDRVTGLVLLLEEWMGDRVTRRAEVTSLALDEPIGDDTFELHLSSDVRRLY